MRTDLAAHVSVLGIFVGILFMYSGFAKLITIRQFAKDLLLLPYVPHRFTPLLAKGIPIIEILAGASSIFGSQWGKACLIAMLTVFSLMALLARSTDLKVPCNCFGSQASEYLSIATVVRSGFLIGITAGSMFMEPRVTLLSALYGLILFLLFVAANAAIQHHGQAIALSNKASL